MNKVPWSLFGLLVLLANPAGCKGIPENTDPSVAPRAIDREVAAETDVKAGFSIDPYLLAGDGPGKMTIIWSQVDNKPATVTAQAKHEDPITVQGTRNGQGLMIARLENLMPGLHYRYTVKVGDEKRGGSFTAPPTPGQSDKLVFMVYGDTRTLTEDHEKVANAMLTYMNRHKASQTLVLHVGDLVENGSEVDGFMNELFNPDMTAVRKLWAKMPVAVTVGNHEQAGPLFATFFPYPFVADRYWSFNYGPMHVAVLDQYASLEADSPQIKWLTRDLAIAKNRWKVLLVHEPGWVTNGLHKPNQAMRQVVQPLLVKYGVQAVFAGHVHNYARALVDGVAHFTCGGGGAPLYPSDGGEGIQKAKSINHFCLVSINHTEMTVTALDVNLNQVDQFTIGQSNRDQKTPPGRVPTGP